MQRSAEFPNGEIATEESGASAVTWSAIIGGAVAAAAVTLILLTLGSGIGFASVRPWPNAGDSATAFGVKAAIWLIVVQWLSSAFGGYLAGRLRAKWVGIHTDESFFRDTAHGVLSWALASVIGAALLTSAAASLVGETARAGASVAAAAAPSMGREAGPAGNPMAYFTDSLFRSDRPSTDAQNRRAESSRIILTGLSNGGVSDADKAYLAQLVAAETGLSQADAAKRVDDVIAKIKAAQDKLRQDAETARKAAAYAAFFTAFSMLIGAFIAGAAGALGGAHRDHYSITARRQAV